jgi:PAS domain S-box-containing protein
MEKVHGGEVFFKEIALNCGDGLFAPDNKKRIVFANKAAELITGYPADELISMDFDQIVSMKKIEEIIEKRAVKENPQKFVTEI